MPNFVAIRTLPGITPDALAGAASRIKTCAAGMSSEGAKVRWIRSFFLPSVSQTHCYFEGPSLQAVEELNQRAGVPFEKILEVAEMTPEAV